jgi:hypothetical protein
VRGRGSEEHKRALFVVGVLVIRLSGEAKRRKVGSGLAYSLDRLVPVIKLDVMAVFWMVLARRGADT